MKCILGRIVPAVLLCVPLLTFAAPAGAQSSVSAAAPPAISVLDSTKDQDGLIGSVRRVKTETAKIEIKEGRPIEGPLQLVEVTTYGIKGNRIENTSYPITNSVVGKEEYKYDERGNITEMTLRDERSAILSREAYSYEFDKFGNWTRMVTSLVVFENGELKREPVEVTYRTLTYYFDDNIARAVGASSTRTKPVAPTPTVTLAGTVPEAASAQVESLDDLEIDYSATIGSNTSIGIAENPPRLTLRVEEAPARVEKPLATRVEKPAPAPVEKPAVAPLDKQASDLYLTGRNRFDEGDMKGAVESFLQSIKLEPRSAEVFFNLGHAYLKLEKDNEAMRAFKDSIKLNPEQPEAFYGLGFAALRRGRFREAVDAFKQATVLSPRMAKAHYGLSLAYQELGQTSRVLEEYRILETLDKSLAKKLVLTFPQYNFSCRQMQGCP